MNFPPKMNDVILKMRKETHIEKVELKDFAPLVSLDTLAT